MISISAENTGFSALAGKLNLSACQWYATLFFVQFHAQKKALITMTGYYGGKSSVSSVFHHIRRVMIIVIMMCMDAPQTAKQAK